MTYTTYEILQTRKGKNKFLTVKTGHWRGKKLFRNDKTENDKIRSEEKEKNR